MYPIYILWAVPRTTSTAFEWMMRMRGDMTCFHEPFGECWYQGDDALAPRLDADSPRQPGLTFAGVRAALADAAKSRPVFSKDMPQFSDHMWSDDFFAAYTHAFLIRDPAKIMASMARTGEEFTLKEMGFEDQQRLFDILADRDGHVPFVMDSDDIMEDPQAMVRMYCEAMGFDFKPEALSWEAGARSEVLWYDKDGKFHDMLKKSDGLKPQRRTYTDPADLPDWAKRQYDAAVPHYRYLHAHRRVVEAAAKSA